MRGAHLRSYLLLLTFIYLEALYYIIVPGGEGGIVRDKFKISKFKFNVKQ